MMNKKRKRFFIESQEKIGKTVSMFLTILKLYKKFEDNNF